MKKVKIMGREFELRNGDEVSYGAFKRVEKAKFAASLSMMSDEEVGGFITNDAKKEGGISEENFMEKIVSGDIKNALINSQDAAVTSKEETIMFSADLTREEILNLPAKMVEELGKAADDALGGLANFMNALTINST